MDNNENVIEIESQEEGRQSMVKKNNTSSVVISNIMSNGELLQDVYGFVKDIQKNKYQIKALELQSQAAIAQMTMKFQHSREVLSAVFNERATGLNKHYAALDKALESNDRELIIAALSGISQIISKSPLADYNKFLNAFDNTDETLMLDF